MPYTRVDVSERADYIIYSALEIGELTNLEAALCFYIPEVAMAVDHYLGSVQEMDIRRIAQIALNWLFQQPLTELLRWSLFAVRFAKRDYESYLKYYQTLTVCRLYGANEYDEVYSWLKISPAIERQRLVLDFAYSSGIRDEHLDVFDIDSLILTPSKELELQQPTKPAKLTKRTQQAQRVIKRAYKAASKFGYGAEVVILFSKGRVTVTSPYSGLCFHFELGYSTINALASMSHGAITITVTNAHNQPLFKLCAFIKDTPSIDQYVAFSTYVKQGLEFELLKVGNPYDVSELGLAYLRQHDLAPPELSFTPKAADEIKDVLHHVKPNKRIKRLATDALHRALGHSPYIQRFTQPRL